MIEEKDIQKSLHNCKQILVLNSINIESLLSKAESTLDNDTKLMYRLILDNMNKLRNLIETIDKIR